jgi:hypothetical protein
LKAHEYISIDYPIEVNPTKREEFLKKSIKNNFLYADNLHYICCIQIEHMDFDTFLYRYNELKDIFENKKKILGIGCLHNKLPNEFSDKVIHHLIKNASHLYWIHFYGISLALVKAYLPILQTKGVRVSFDSTKYKFAANDKIRTKYGFTVGRKMTSLIFFYGYIEKLLDTGMSFIW